MTYYSERMKLKTGSLVAINCKQKKYIKSCFVCLGLCWVKFKYRNMQSRNHVAVWEGAMSVLREQI